MNSIQTSELNLRVFEDLNKSFRPVLVESLKIMKDKGCNVREIFSTDATKTEFKKGSKVA